ncbi:hypothetical protein B0H13DRAFT_2306630 [Mycena leptocephala]|nr:hypothetical protein B0H13DRAFT_2306630 [Mycena leptocephala]
MSEWQSAPIVDGDEGSRRLAVRFPAMLTHRKDKSHVCALSHLTETNHSAAIANRAGTYKAAVYIITALYYGSGKSTDEPEDRTSREFASCESEGRNTHKSVHTPGFDPVALFLPPSPQLRLVYIPRTHIPVSCPLCGTSWLTLVLTASSADSDSDMASVARKLSNSLPPSLWYLSSRAASACLWFLFPFLLHCLQYAAHVPSFTAHWPH